jgi:hypothetical protein
MTDHTIAILRSWPFQKWAAEVDESLKTTTKENMIASLRPQLQKAIEMAKGMVPKLQADERKFRVETPEVTEEEVEVTDLVVLDPSTQEFKAVAKFAQHPVMCIKRVDIKEREDRFKAYVQHLPQDKRAVTETYHGTPRVASGNNIARHGPDLKRAGQNVGSAYGAGFYTAKETQTPAGYSRGTGSVLVCEVAMGNYMRGGDGSVTAATLAGHPKGPYDSVLAHGDTYYILFHPDAIRIKYVIDHGTDDGDDAQEIILRRQKYEAACAKRELKEKMRIAKVVKCQGQTAGLVGVVVARGAAGEGADGAGDDGAGVLVWGVAREGLVGGDGAPVILAYCPDAL